ncbi:DUF2971 domain-containing protein [Nitrospina watsonii]|uniref:DUF2971 domain-containing protein n=1 Tax=Nitrospina watsonii TaxID=1323948 RepID=A0ABM9HEL5_9BACT|nr:DUF2971 domain-containing protein [Nitrospina watsonii]CAI2718681.1 conserved protein of unknown function [Nitrospina watsonii]
MTQEIWDLYPEVYHYTPFSSALLILNSKALRATLSNRLNDTQEIIYAKNQTIKEILKLDQSLYPEQIKEDLNSLYESVGRIYITSFCGKNQNTIPYHRDNGLLGMWRNYGADGGCAIIFKTRNIYDRANSFTKIIADPPKVLPALSMEKVIYEGGNDDDIDFRERLERYANNYIKFRNNYPSKKEYQDPNSNIWREFVIDQLNLMLHTKHPAFFEEQEIRMGLILIEKKFEGEPPKNNPDSFLIPFSPSEDISRIIIGPHRDQQPRYDFLKTHLSLAGLDIEVTKSEIPLRF